MQKIYRTVNNFFSTFPPIFFALLWSCKDNFRYSEKNIIIIIGDHPAGGGGGNLKEALLFHNIYVARHK